MDFEILYSELERWRLQEIDRIHALQASDADKRALLYQTLLKEVKLVQTIDKLKASAASDARQQKIGKVLQQMASSKKWEMSDGTVTLVDTPETIRAQQLAELFEVAGRACRIHTSDADTSTALH